MDGLEKLGSNFGQNLRYKKLIDQANLEGLPFFNKIVVGKKIPSIFYYKITKFKDILLDNEEMVDIYYSESNQELYLHIKNFN